MRAFAFVFGIFSALIIACIVGAQWDIERRRPKPILRDTSVYYRLKVGLTYKGQPIDVNIVGGCGVRATFGTAQGGSTVETMAMSAFVFGVRMPEGHAVVIRSDPPRSGIFDVCQGATTANGDVPKDWLPFIAWYEDDNNFAHGIGYATQDAYESPRARFGFRGASIEHATRADFEAFMRVGPQNLLPPYLSDAITHLDAPRLPLPVPPDLIEDPTKAWRYTGGWPICAGVYSVRLTEAQRAKTRALWPANHPKYWAPSPHAMIDFQSKVLSREQQNNENEYVYRRPYTDEMKTAQAKIYPISADNTLDGIKRALEKGTGAFDRTLLVDDPSWLGFEFCDSDIPPKLFSALAGKPEPAWPHPLQCRVAHLTLPVSETACDTGFWTAFEGDTFAFFGQQNFFD